MGLRKESHLFWYRTSSGTNGFAECQPVETVEQIFSSGKTIFVEADGQLFVITRDLDLLEVDDYEVLSPDLSLTGIVP